MAVPIEIPDLVRRKALALGSEGERWMASLGDSLAVFEERVGDRGRPTVPRRQRGLRRERHDRRRRARRAQARDARRARRQRQVRAGAAGGAAGPRTRIRRTSSQFDEAPSGDAARALGPTDPRRRAAHRGADRRHRRDRGAGLATTREPLALANGRGAGRVVGALDRRDVGSARSAVPRAPRCGSPRSTPAGGARAFDEATAVAIHGDAHPWNVLESPAGGFKLIDPDGMWSEPAHDLAIPLRHWNERAAGRRRGHDAAILVRAPSRNHGR